MKVWDPRVKDAVLALEPEDGSAARDCWAACFGKGGGVRGATTPIPTQTSPISATRITVTAIHPGNSYNDTERCVAAGYDNGDVKLFDLRTNRSSRTQTILNK